MLPIELCLAILEYVLEPGALERRGADAMDASEFTVICRTWRKALDARVRVFYANQLDESPSGSTNMLSVTDRRRFPLLVAYHATANAIALTSRDGHCDASVSDAVATATTLMHTGGFLFARRGPKCEEAEEPWRAQDIRLVSRFGKSWPRCDLMACLLALDLSHTAITDANIGEIRASCSSLEDLNVNSCSELANPAPWIQEDVGDSLTYLSVEGCQNLSNACLASLFRLHASASPLRIDRFDASLEEGEECQVVILSGRYKGEWTPALVLTAGLGAYDIYVHETTKYNNAIGFSGRFARRIARKHLRRTPSKEAGAARLRRMLDREARGVFSDPLRPA